MNDSNILTQQRAGKYLSFQIGGEVLGVDIHKIKEILGIMMVMRVRRLPGSGCGVIDLRGQMIPVVDLRPMFDLPVCEDTDRAGIIVLRTARGGETLTVGLLVDEVAEVLHLREDQIEPAPPFGAAVDSEFSLGLGKADGQVLTLLDIDRLLPAGQMMTTKQTAMAAA